MSQPTARIDVVRDTYFGTTIEDPYRWMEDRKSEEFQSWIKAQAEHTRAYLEALPERKALLDRITDLDNANTTYAFFTSAGGRIFYLVSGPQDQVPKLAVRLTSEGPEKVLLDPNQLEGEAHASIDWYYPSRDGHYVAYGLSEGGSENSILHVLEVDTAKVLDLAINRTHFGEVTWLEDNQSFLYRRFPELSEDAAPTEFYNDARIYLHRLGSNPDKDLLVFGRDVNSRVEMVPEDIPFVATSAESDWAIGQIMHGDRNELTLYAAQHTAITEPTMCPWTKIADVEDEVTGYTYVGDTIYLLTHKDAPRYKVVATSLAHPNMANATVVVSESASVIQDILAVGDHVLTRDLDGGIGRMRQVRRETGEIKSISLPLDGTIREWTHEALSQEVLIKMESWTVSPHAYRYNVGSNKLIDTGWIPSYPIDTSTIEIHEVFAPAKDGTQIPLSILHKKGLVLNGNNPTLIEGYGSYGISYTAFFWPTMLAWYERGGVFAVAHIRGGGEYGDAWHKAGHMLNKQNTIDDFIACAEYLVKQGYTRPERLAGQGGSAGGIPSGGALVQRPDLWAVMVMQVPVTNALRFEFTENGPPNIQEFGSVTTEDGFKGLQIIDAYTHVKDGVRYPAVLLTAGVNDPRVVAWQPAKMTARLQTATTSGKPVLLRLETQGGHGVGSTKKQENELLADILAFLWQQFEMK